MRVRFTPGFGRQKYLRIPSKNGKFSNAFLFPSFGLNGHRTCTFARACTLKKVNKWERKSWGLWKHDWERAVVLVRKQKVNNRPELPAASTKWSGELHSPRQRGRPLTGGGWGPSAARDPRLMRNSWGFRGAQRSSFSHCAHGPPVALALRVPFQRRNIPEERRDPPTSCSTRAGARLPCCIMYMRCRITTCHPGFTGKKCWAV